MAISRFFRAVCSGLLLAGLLVAPMQSASAANPRVVLDTSMGEVVVELFPEDAPVTVANFLEYVDEGFYDETIFHRVKPWFVVQGGGVSTFYNRKPTRGTIVNESDNGLRNQRGTVAMARYADPDSAASQFYFNVEDNDGLDPSEKKAGYTVFGRVISGMEVIDAISELETHAAHGFTNLPVEQVVVESVRRLK